MFGMQIIIQQDETLSKGSVRKNYYLQIICDHSLVCKLHKYM